NLAAQCKNSIQPYVQLTWTASADASTYKMFRSETDGGPYSPYGNVTINGFTTTINDAGVTSGHTYYYVLQSVKNGVNSGNSNHAAATICPNGPTAPATGNGTAVGTGTLPSAPTGLVVTPRSGLGVVRVDLSWTGVSDPGAAYTVHRSPTNGATDSFPKI